MAKHYTKKEKLSKYGKQLEKIEEQAVQGPKESLSIQVDTASAVNPVTGLTDIQDKILQGKFRGYKDEHLAKAFSMTVTEVREEIVKINGILNDRVTNFDPTAFIAQSKTIYEQGMSQVLNVMNQLPVEMLTDKLKCIKLIAELNEKNISLMKETGFLGSSVAEKNTGTIIQNNYFSSLPEDAKQKIAELALTSGFDQLEEPELIIDGEIEEPD